MTLVECSFIEPQTNMTADAKLYTGCASVYKDFSPDSKEAIAATIFFNDCYQGELWIGTWGDGRACIFTKRICQQS